MRFKICCNCPDIIGNHCADFGIFTARHDNFKEHYQEDEVNSMSAR